MRPEDFDVQDLIDTLVGTCQMLSEALPEGMEEDDLTDADREELDSRCFCCEVCGWWVEDWEINEEADGAVCCDCQGDGQDDEPYDED